jgi:beta-glucosidase
MYAGNDLIEPGNNVNQVIQATLPTAATIAANGLIRFTTTEYIGDITYAWSLGSLVLSATGGNTITNRVDSTTNLGTAWASVDAAYRSVKTALADPVNGLTAAQKAAITVTVNAGTDETAVTDYTVTIKGDYKASMRLGDLQRSAINILNVLVQTVPFGQLATLQGQTGITIPAYSAQYGSTLKSYLAQETQPISGGGLPPSLTTLQIALDAYAQIIAAESLYTPVSFAPFKAAYDDAVILANSLSTTEAQAAAALARLAATSGSALVYAVNTAFLEAMIAVAEGIVAEAPLYTAGTVTALNAALVDAYAALNNPAKTSTTIAAAAAALQTVIQSAKLAGDPATLAALVDFASDLNATDWTGATWTRLTTALAAARTVLGLPEPSAGQIDEAYAALETAVRALALRANKAGLQSAIDVAESIVANSSLYVPSTVTALNAALVTARYANNDTNATLAQVTAAMITLVEKIAAVRLANPGPAPQALAAAGGAGAASAAAASAPVAKLKPAAKPAIKGKAKVGKTLKAKAVKWNAAGVDVSYKWLRDGKAIKGATDATYTLKAKDKGKRIAVKVTGSKAGFAAKAATSAKTAKVKA